MTNQKDHLQIILAESSTDAERREAVRVLDDRDRISVCRISRGGWQPAPAVKCEHDATAILDGERIVALVSWATRNVLAFAPEKAAEKAAPVECYEEVS